MSVTPDLISGTLIANVFFLREIERLLMVGIAGVSIYLGWTLFRITPVEHGGEADISGMGWRLAFKRIGPGIFFALFGAAIVMTSLLRPITAENLVAKSLAASDNSAQIMKTGARQQAAEEVISAQVISGFGGQGDANGQLQFVHLLNTVLALASAPSSDAGVIAGYHNDLRRVEARIVTLRDSIVDGQFDSNAADLWRKDHTRFLMNPNKFSREETVELVQLQHWMQDGIASEDGTSTK